MAFKLAFVNFFHESNGRRIVQVEDVKDYSPKFPDDYDEDKTYEVRWPHQPTDQSFSTEGFFEAKILCIGVDYKDLASEAKRKNLRMPKLTEGDCSEKPKSKKPKKSSKGRELVSVVPTAAPVTPTSRPPKKKKVSVQQKVKDDRVKKVIDNYKDLTPSKLSPQDVSVDPTTSEPLKLMEEQPRDTITSQPLGRRVKAKSQKFANIDSTTDEESIPSTVSISSADAINIHVLKIYNLETRLKERDSEIKELKDQIETLQKKYKKAKEKLFGDKQKETLNSGSLMMSQSECQPRMLAGFRSHDKETSTKAVKSLFSSSPAVDDSGSGLKRKLEQVERTPKKVKKVKQHDPLEDGIAGNSVLGGLINQAFSGKCPLDTDGAGKLHIGNNTYLSKHIFDTKISKPTVSPSIALRDATRNVYTEEELAQRSLEGGTPVKGNKTHKKKKMTPAKREALLGLYRAKVMQTTGNANQDFLHLSMKKGKETLRNRLKEAARKLLLQEQEQASAAEATQTAANQATSVAEATEKVATQEASAAEATQTAANQATSVAEATEKVATQEASAAEAASSDSDSSMSFSS